MAEEICLCLDLGTTGIKAAAFDERLTCLGSATVENRLHYPAPGLVEQDPDYFFAAALDLSRQVTAGLGAAARRVVAIVCSGQMGGALGIDADWNAVTHFDAILDPRSNAVRPLIAPHEEYLLPTCGGLTTQLEKILYWRAHRPEAYARAAKFIGLNGFVAGKLAGLSAAEAFTDLTFTMVSGLLSAVTGVWDERLLETFAVPRAILPLVVESRAVVGQLRPDLADQLGLPQGVPVLAGAGDGAATFAGSGINRQGQAVDLSGTSCAFGLYSDAYLPDGQPQTFLNMKSPTAPGWFVIYINHFGRTHRWFLDAFCEELVRERGVEAAYAALDEQAAALPPGAAGLLAVPHLTGRPSPPGPFVRGAWLGFGLGFTRAHFYRSLLEAHAVEFGLARERLQALHPSLPPVREVTISGGGSRSDFWNQMKADVIEARYRRLVDSGLSTLRGDALIAAQARGWPVAEGPLDFIQYDREYAPDPAAAAGYAPIVDHYRSLAPALDPVMSHLFG